MKKKKICVTDSNVHCHFLHLILGNSKPLMAATIVEIAGLVLQCGYAYIK
jgi:hypothetical protein